jgi:hypothetical protein
MTGLKKWFQSSKVSSYLIKAKLTMPLIRAKIEATCQPSFPDRLNRSHGQSADHRHHCGRIQRAGTRAAVLRCPHLWPRYGDFLNPPHNAGSHSRPSYRAQLIVPYLSSGVTRCWRNGSDVILGGWRNPKMHIATNFVQPDPVAPAKTKLLVGTLE